MKKEEKKQYHREYRLAHKETIRAYGREYSRKHYLAHKEAAKAYSREYYLAHKETVKKYNRKHYREYMRKYRLVNKEAERERNREYRKKIKLERPWVTHFRNAKKRCNNPGSTGYKYYGGKGIKFKLTIDEIKTLYLMYNAKDMDMPSIDRIYNDGHYAFGNCRFIELSENVRRSNVEREK